MGGDLKNLSIQGLVFSSGISSSEVGGYMQMLDSFPCPHCGAEVPTKAKACPECGSDKHTGWSEEAGYLHLLPDTGDPEGDAKLSFVWKKEWIAAIAGLLLIVFIATQVGSTGLYFLLAGGLFGGCYGLYRYFFQGSKGLERKLYRQLLHRTGGDRDQAERLIAYEQKLYPGSKRHQLIQNAIYHWDRDLHLH
jgi:zinc-ribbon domain